jgi:hypothetical protein
VGILNFRGGFLGGPLRPRILARFSRFLGSDFVGLKLVFFFAVLLVADLVAERLPMAMEERY